MEDAYQVNMRNEKVKIKRPYQCGIAVYQLAKVRILEFHNDFADKYLDRRDYELIQIDTDNMYMARSASKFGKLVKSNLVQEYKSDGKPELLATTKYSERIPVFFKTEFVA